MIGSAHSCSGVLSGLLWRPVGLERTLCVEGTAALCLRAEGRSWRLWLSADGARTARLPEPGTAADDDDDDDPNAADASARGTADELVLAMYGRIPVDSVKLDGDRRLFDLLVAWDPED
ncbi:hypothetical protein [Streptomyces sp. WM6378]|uniref:hypothetical protein n=1 Tax=Streptomyces sp. WM6378 TaxID=1415557 RepID=UPI0006B00D9D|nr:hypothetical protein [Streptomyces sp. WM6378]KOU39429.1 hypothetical protein ADK54_25555 [Streptomyces sp. WM6378]